MAQYLTCDDVGENITKYMVDIDGAETETPAVNGAEPGTKHLWFDLTPVAEGSHIVKAKAGNDWGWSDWTPNLPFTKTLPGIPSGLVLEEG